MHMQTSYIYHSLLCTLKDESKFFQMRVNHLEKYLKANTGEWVNRR
jgi:hypothetical protein